MQLQKTLSFKMDVALEYQSLYNMKEELDNYSDNSFLKKYEWTKVLF